MTTQSDLLVERVDGALHLTFNRPHTLNALTTEMLNAAAQAVEACGDDPAVRVVVIRRARRRPAGDP